MSTYEVRDGSGRTLATLDLSRDDKTATFGELRWAGDEHDAAALVEALRAEVKGLSGASLSVAPAETEVIAALQSAPLISSMLIRPISDDSGGARYRDMDDDEYDEWRYTTVGEYAEATLPRYGNDRDVAARESEASFKQLLPKGLKTADTSLSTLLDDDGERVASLWLRHRYTGMPGGQPATFVFDLSVDADRRQQGWGRRALVAVDEIASSAGDDRVGLNVFSDNPIAERLYSTSGFEPVLLTFDLVH